MKYSVRSCFREGGYIYAKKADELPGGQDFDRVARLASNENPFPPSQQVTEAGMGELALANRYPDERPYRLISALKEVHGDYQIVTGAGMDGVIETILRTIVEPGEVVAISTPTFSFYRIAATAHGASVRTVPREGDFSVDADRFIDACQGARLAFLASPNNPTGNGTPPEVVRTILEGIDKSGCVLFLDAAYLEFSDLDYLPLMDTCENLVIGRTMSKAYSLAGLRVGYGFVPEWLEPCYFRAATPFAVSQVSEAAATAALGDREHITGIRRHVSRWRAEFADRVRCPTYPSDANFVLIDVAPRTGDEVAEVLAARGVLVRSCRSFTGLADHYIRVCVGDDWENEQFIEAINCL